MIAALRFQIPDQSLGSAIWKLESRHSILLLFLFELEQIGLVVGLSERFGSILAGRRNAQGQLFAVKLVDTLGGLALGIFGTVVDDQVDGRKRFGIGVDRGLAG